MHVIWWVIKVQDASPGANPHGGGSDSHYRGQLQHDGESGPGEGGGQATQAPPQPQQAAAPPARRAPPQVRLLDREQVRNHDRHYTILIKSP